MKTLMYYDTLYNIIKILHPSGFVEMLNLDPDNDVDWRQSLFSSSSFKDSKSALESFAPHEFIGEL